MKYSCEIIRDLLPLYIDDVASPPSRQFVEEHLVECAECRNMLGLLKNEEAEAAISIEKENVIAGQRKFFKRKSAVIGSVIAGIFMIPILVCLIVNLVTGAGLDWFFIVLSSLLVAASLSIVPLMVPENKRLWTLGSFTASLLLLFGVCCLYTGGQWFFVASSTVLFGLCVILLPFVVRNKVISGYLKDRKGLAVMVVDTILYMAMMLSIGLYTKNPSFFTVVTAISVPILLLIWGLFFIICNAKKIKRNQDIPTESATEFSDFPKNKERKKDMPGRRLKRWQIVLLILGSPVWIAILIAVIVVLLSIYIAIWAVIVSLWMAEISFIVGSIGSIVMGIWSICQNNGLQGIVMLSAGVVLAGLSILMFFFCKAATRGVVILTKKFVSWIKYLFQRKEYVK